MSSDSADPTYRDAAADFLGLLACIEVTAFQQRGRDVSFAANAADMTAVGSIAAAGLGRFQSLCDRLTALNADPDERMAPFQAAAAEYERRTAPADALESIVKVCVADSLAADFHRQAVPRLDAESGKLVDDLLSPGDRTALVTRVGERAGADRVTADRLSLWARRLIGEVLARAQAAVAARPGIAHLIFEGDADHAALMRAFNRSVAQHAQRVRDLGLAP